MSVRIHVEGLEPEAVHYGVQVYLERNDPSFKRRPLSKWAKRRQEFLRREVRQAVSYALGWGRDQWHQLRLCRQAVASGKATLLEQADHLADQAMDQPGAPRSAGAVLAVLLGILGRALLKLVLSLVLEWLLSLESQRYRCEVWGVT